ncbi:hypothetical protein Ocin01_06815 [Orchesella cincta]|uniref:Cation channel sperm-associated targeting subunit tau C2 domain-containing protein n=1 Tax=Orchesella cincta TaxID=48709 RepID=A0A1D2N480_ORCCI|nr:hypothetical protein Ocin01_06815 [Orchesella cincta]
MAFVKTGKRQLRLQELEKELPQRVRKEPRPGDNPLKRPYPPHARDIEIVDALLEAVPREIPTEFVSRDMRTATRPQGVLYFHVLDIQDLKLSTKDFITGAPFCVYMEYECQGMIKCSYPVLTHHHPKIRIDHYAHFSANVSEVRSDEANDLVVHVYAFQDPEKHWLIGSQLLHLFNFVRDIHGVDTIQIVDDLSYYVGRVTFEFAWAYGSFGYGHSNQLRNTKNPVYHSVCHSMFPRIAPRPEDLIDNKFRVRVPKNLRLINLHSLMVRVPLKKEKRGIELVKSKNKKEDMNKEAKSMIFRRVKYSRGRPVHAALNLDIHQKFMENDFNQAYGEFICLRSRRERLEHLTRMVEGRLRDRVESDATGLFHRIPDIQDCRAGLEIKKPLACPPGYLEHHLHPKACPPTHPVKLTEKDEEFISKITSAPRFSGYLATVFGYTEKTDGAEEPKPMPVQKHEYIVHPYAFLGEGESEIDRMTFVQRVKYEARKMWYKTWLWWDVIADYIFPSPISKYEDKLPEISVTLPSPADSTTEFYAHCVQEKIYPKVADLTKIKRQATTLVKAARRKKRDGEDDEDDWQTEGEEEPDYELLPKEIPDDGYKSGKRLRDKRVMEHVEKARFGNPHQRPVVTKPPDLYIGDKTRKF